MCVCLSLSLHIYIYTIKGRDMVDFVVHAMPFHTAQELDSMEGDEETRKRKVLRAFLMADIHARSVGITSSGAAVALCLVQVCMHPRIDIIVSFFVYYDLCVVASVALVCVRVF